MARLVVVTNGNYFARLILERLFAERTHHIVGVVVVSGDYAGRSATEAVWHVGRLTDPHYTAYKVAQHFLFRVASKIFPEACFDVMGQVRVKDLEAISVRRVNSPDVEAYIRGTQPDLLISVSCPQRIKNTLLSIPKLGSLNIHASLLPEYAGLAPYYWVLAKGEQRTGISVHYMTDKFDDGNLLVQKVLSIRKGASAFELFIALSKLGSDALVEAVDLALNGSLGTPQDVSRRSYCSHPTPDSYKSLKGHGFAIARMSEMLQAIRKEVRNAQ